VVKVVVVGAGLTGLATAWYVRDAVDVTVLEAGDRVGGEIDTVAFAGAATDVGADAFLARRPEAERLARAAGLGDDLVAPATAQVHLWIGGVLRPLPEGTVLGVPTDLAALARSGVLSPAGLARAALEPALPRRRVVGDRSLADLIGERYGREVVDRLVEPLLSGVYAGAADRLSTQATAPPVWAAATEHRSLRAGLLVHRARVAADDRPVFLTVRGGLSRLVDALARPLGTTLRRGTAATAVARGGDGWVVATTDGELRADAVVLAVPAATSARLLAGVAPDVARELLAIGTASVAVVALAYDRSAAAAVPEGSGFLVPRSEGRLVKAATWTSRKWPHHADRDRFVLRASVGRVDDPRGLDLDDDTLADRVDAEVRWAAGITAPATDRLVRRWDAALPQYDVGHLARVDRIRHAVGELDGLLLGGAALDGVGLAARAAEAERFAHTLRERAERRAAVSRPRPVRAARGPRSGRR
jgi:protoporphyrinogen/coproporphyrinogen III oxidase